MTAHWDTMVVQEQIALAIDAACADTRGQLQMHFRCWPSFARPPVESPMEAVFAAWWAAVQIVGSDEERRLELVSQHSVTCAAGEVYRLDFAVFMRDAAVLPTSSVTTGIGVEIDGHEWHERTIVQVTRRNQRDRRLGELGWRLFHFSGSELLRRPRACVAEVMDAAVLVVMDTEWAGRRHG